MDTNTLSILVSLMAQKQPGMEAWIPSLVTAVLGLIATAVLWLKADTVKKESDTARRVAELASDGLKKQSEEAAVALKEIHTVVNSRTDALTQENKALQKIVAELQISQAQILEKLRGSETANAVREAAKGVGAPGITTVVKESAAASPLANLPIPLPVIPVKPLT